MTGCWMYLTEIQGVTRGAAAFYYGVHCYTSAFPKLRVWDPK